MLFQNLRKKYYVTGELKTKQEIEGIEQNKSLQSSLYQ